MLISHSVKSMQYVHAVKHSIFVVMQMTKCVYNVFCKSVYVSSKTEKAVQNKLEIVFKLLAGSIFRKLFTTAVKYCVFKFTTILQLYLVT